jgi:hypothetical protein
MAKAKKKRTAAERAQLDAEAQVHLAAQEREQEEAEANAYRNAEAADRAPGGIEVPPDPAAKPVGGMTPEQRAAYEERTAAEAAGGTQALVTRIPGASEADPEALLVVCNSCRSTAWTVGKASATAISLTCAQCGGRASVKAAVGPARVPIGLAALAVENYVHPTPKAAPPPADGDDDGEGTPSLGDQGFMTIRARITREQYEATIRRAMEAVRVQNNREDAFRSQQWQGTALEYICADYLSGVDPRILEIVDAQEAAVEAEAERFRAQGEELPAKRARVVRAQTRDALADALDADARRLVRAPHQTPDLDKALADRAAEAAAREAEEAEDDRVPDDGALGKAVRAAIRDYADAFAVATPGERLEYLVGYAGTRKDLVTRWDAAGGFLLSIRGDVRAKTGAKRCPEIWLWIGAEFDGATLALDAEYADEMFDTLPEADLEVIELLPKGYAGWPADDQWDAPSVASRREEIQ